MPSIHTRASAASEDASSGVAPSDPPAKGNDSTDDTRNNHNQSPSAGAEDGPSVGDSRAPVYPGGYPGFYGGPPPDPNSKSAQPSYHTYGGSPYQTPYGQPGVPYAGPFPGQSYPYPPAGRGQQPSLWGYTGYGGEGASSSSPPSGGYPAGGGASRSTRGGRTGLPGKMPYSPTRSAKGSPDGIKLTEGTAKSSPGGREGTKKMDDLEAERARNAASADAILSEVAPIETDFHFFVKDLQGKLKIEAEDDVKKSTFSIKDSDDGKINRLYLLNTNLNARLLRSWEDLPKESRDKYMEREELDRRRFMEEDEVASRHCFTLTARVRADEGSKKEEEKAEESSKRPGSQREDDTSSKKIKAGV